MSSPDNPGAIERMSDENPPDGASSPTEPDSQSDPDETKGKIKEVIQKAKEGFDSLRSLSSRMGRSLVGFSEQPPLWSAC